MKPIELYYGNQREYNGMFPTLGLDTEIVVASAGRPLYPHMVNLPQHRPSAREVTSWKDNGSLWDWHGDGFAFELCVKPTVCLDVMMDMVGTGLYYGLEANLETLGQDRRHLSFAAPVIYEIASEVVHASPKNVVRLGCAPSFNIYSDKSADPTILLGQNKRTTGCHLHLSHPDMTNDMGLLLIQWADILVGNSWTYISPEDPNEEAFRRQAYGRAGEHRRNYYPPIDSRGNDVFGVEYRVLPGRPLLNPVYLTLMFRLYRAAWTAVHAFGMEEPTVWARAARIAINNADKKLALEVINDLPFDNETRATLERLKQHPLPNLNPYDWYIQARNGYGIKEWAYRSGIL